MVKTRSLGVVMINVEGVSISQALLPNPHCPILICYSRPLSDQHAAVIDTFLDPRQGIHRMYLEESLRHARQKILEIVFRRAVADPFNEIYRALVEVLGDLDVRFTAECRDRAAVPAPEGCPWLRPLGGLDAGNDTTTDVEMTVESRRALKRRVVGNGVATRSWCVGTQPISHAKPILS